MAFSLRSVLNGLTTDRLRAFAKLLTAERKPTQKDELVRFVEKHLLLNVIRLWNELDTLDKNAISETLHSPGTIFDPQRFKAKYGRLPFGINWTSSRSEPPILKFFLHWHSTYLSIPDEIVSQLKGHVSKPIPFKLNTSADLPDRYTQKQKRYDSIANSATARVAIVQEELETNKREMEFAAQQDLQTVLRLTAKEGIKISGKTKRVSESTAKGIAQLLLGGDFYEIISKKVAWEQEIGPIRSFAWPMLLQAAKLAEVSGAKLALTKEGSKALNVPPHITLRTIWQHLLKTTLFDEFHRIDNIKGQNRRGGGSLSDVIDRRSAIANGLSQLPLSQWVTPAEFSRFMQGTGLHFEVSYNPWDLYISDPEHGSLGYDGSHDWSILQGRYIACFLFEYAATLGMIDVAYVSPFDINADYASLWGSDTIPFLSRYDGLVHFRLNALGAYCLGLTDHYEPSEERVRTKVSVMPSLQISVLEETLSPATALLLDTYAEQEAPTVWRLASNKAISALERGHKIAELREFLETSDEQPLPETVEAFINKTDRGARALRNAGPAILVECESEEIAESIKNATCTKDLCLQADSKLLVVRAAALEKFRKAVNILGYGMPKEAEI